MSANTYQPWTRDSSTASEIEKFERISLNNLLLKCKGAPYEDALRRIIKQKLADNFSKAKAGDEIRENGRGSSPYDEGVSPSKSSAKRAVDIDARKSLVKLIAGSNSGSPQHSQRSHSTASRSHSPHSRGSPVSPANQRAFHRQLKANTVSDERNSDPGSQSNPVISSSMQEFQKWLVTNKLSEEHVSC